MAMTGTISVNKTVSYAEPVNVTITVSNSSGSAVTISDVRLTANPRNAGVNISAPPRLLKTSTTTHTPSYAAIYYGPTAGWSTDVAVGTGIIDESTTTIGALSVPASGSLVLHQSFTPRGSYRPGAKPYVVQIVAEIDCSDGTRLTLATPSVACLWPNTKIAGSAWFNAECFSGTFAALFRAQAAR